MTTTATPPVECEQLHPALSVSDVLAAADFYTKTLGFWHTSLHYGNIITYMRLLGLKPPSS